MYLFSFLPFLLATITGESSCSVTSCGFSSSSHSFVFLFFNLSNLHFNFRTPNMRTKTFLITLNWFANETVYLGLSYYGPSLGTNPPLSFFLSSLVELPGYVFCWYVMDRFGRRWPMCLLMICGGISCCCTVLLPENSETETLVLYLISKSMVCGSFLIIYPFAGELYPTQARGVGIGFSSYVGGLGLIIIPFITYLGEFKSIHSLFYDQS